MYPDRLVSLQDRLVFLSSKKGPNNSYTHVPMRMADSVRPMATNSPFGHLLLYLYGVLHEGVTTYLEEFHRYLVRDVKFPAHENNMEHDCPDDLTLTRP